MKKFVTLVAMAAFCVSLAGNAFAGGDKADAGKGNAGNPGVAPPQSMPYGMSYGEWSAEWWKYCMPMTLDVMPFARGTDGTIGQSGHVWFLGGSFTWPDNLVREITVPAGTALFFPIFNVECSTLETDGWGDPNWGEAELRAAANHWIDDVAFLPPPEGWGVQLYCRLNGVEMKNLMQYRCETPLISITIPAMDSNLFWAPTTEPTPVLSVGDGFYIFLYPLPVGTHTLEFSGGDVHYTIHVVPDDR